MLMEIENNILIELYIVTCTIKNKDNLLFVKKQIAT